MTYAEVIEKLNTMGPELAVAKPGRPVRKFTLEAIGLLLEALGHPQKRFASVLIAGTNGKGSTAATLASIGSAALLRTGLYTSPHLLRVNERIQLSDGTSPHFSEISNDDFAVLFALVD